MPRHLWFPIRVNSSNFKIIIAIDKNINSINNNQDYIIKVKFLFALNN